MTGLRIKEVLKEKEIRMTQGDLAALTKMSRTRINQIIRNDECGLQTLEKIAISLGVSLQSLFKGNKTEIIIDNKKQLRIREILKERNITQLAFSKKTGLPLTSINRIFHNQVKPHPYTLAKMAKALDMQPNDLYISHKEVAAEENAKMHLYSEVIEAVNKVVDACETLPPKDLSKIMKELREKGRKHADVFMSGIRNTNIKKEGGITWL